MVLQDSSVLIPKTKQNPLKTGLYLLKIYQQHLKNGSFPVKISYNLEYKTLENLKEYGKSLAIPIYILIFLWLTGTLD